MITHCWHNGKIIPLGEATISIFDSGLIRGYGIFDFMPIIGSKILYEEDYLERFQNSAQFINLPLNYSKEEIASAILELSEQNSISDGYSRLLLTGGQTLDGFNLAGQPNFFILNHELINYDPAMFENGEKLITSHYVRKNAIVKSLNYLNVLKEQERIKEEKAFDLLFHENGWISESSRSNFFIIQNGDLVTPGKNILKGVTRKHVLEVAQDHCDIIIRDVHMDELRISQEAFITSSTKGILPITQIDDVKLGNGQVGPVTKLLMEALKQDQRAYLD